MERKQCTSCGCEFPLLYPHENAQAMPLNLTGFSHASGLGWLRIAACPHWTLAFVRIVTTARHEAVCPSLVLLLKLGRASTWNPSDSSQPLMPSTRPPPRKPLPRPH